jgi:hypothetical protein
MSEEVPSYTRLVPGQESGGRQAPIQRIRWTWLFMRQCVLCTPTQYLRAKYSTAAWTR